MAALLQPVQRPHDARVRDPHGHRARVLLQPDRRLPRSRMHPLHEVRDRFAAARAVVGKVCLPAVPLGHGDAVPRPAFPLAEIDFRQRRIGVVVRHAVRCQQGLQGVRQLLAALQGRALQAHGGRVPAMRPIGSIRAMPCPIGGLQMGGKCRGGGVRQGGIGCHVQLPVADAFGDQRLGVAQHIPAGRGRG